MRSDPKATLRESAAHLEMIREATPRGRLLEAGLGSACDRAR